LDINNLAEALNPELSVKSPDVTNKSLTVAGGVSIPVGLGLWLLVGDGLSLIVGVGD
jgi:hypothetical protein